MYFRMTNLFKSKDILSKKSVIFANELKRIGLMKMMNYAMMRCVSAIAIGVLLMVWPEAAILYLVIAIGVVFFLPSLYSLIGYLRKGRQLGMYFPIVSLGGLLFGLWLMISPAFFVGILMYVLGAVLVFAATTVIQFVVDAANDIMQ